MVRPASGFTLIEIMVVISILALLMVTLAPRLSRRGATAKNVVRKISVLSRDLHVRAQLKNQTYRIVFSIPEEASAGEDAEAPSYWVETSQNAKVFFASSSDDDDSDDDSAASKKKKKKLRGGFQVDTSLIKEPVRLPSGMEIEDIEIISKDEPITKGKIYIHYLPQGLAEEAAIHLKWLEKIKWTIAIHPITGRADIANKYISLKDLRDQ